MNTVGADRMILKRAQHGDWDTLAEHIEKGGRITDEMRKYIADILRRKIKRSANRPPKKATFLRNMQYAEHAIGLEMAGLGATDAGNKTAEVFGVHERTIQRAKKALAKRVNKSLSDIVNTLQSGAQMTGKEIADVLVASLIRELELGP
jgi:hypothetical protein